MENDILVKVKGYIGCHGMINSGDRICVAVSGGADSMCLLFLMHELKESMGFFLSAVHVEHGIREQASVDDMKFVIHQCDRLGISLETARVDAAAISEQTGTTLEEAARNERYRVFSGLKADRIALAHHMNDQAETFIFNAARGSGVKGLRGMQAVRERYIRPLLCITRGEIEAYCRNRHIEYRQDATNDDIYISRNRIRHVLMPELLKINAGAVRHIFDITEDLSEAEECLDILAQEAFGKCVITALNGRSADIVINLDVFDGLHTAMASLVIKEALIQKAGRARDIARCHVDAVISLAKGQSGRHADLIYGIKAYKEFRQLIIRGPGEYEISEGNAATGGAPAPNPVYTVLGKEEVAPERITSAENYTKYIDYATIGDTSLLKVRHRKQGDHISIKGGNKKVKDLLIEEKIPAERRDEMFFVALMDEIVWIPELNRIGERFKVTDETDTILKMEIKNG